MSQRGCRLVLFVLISSAVLAASGGRALAGGLFAQTDDPGGHWAASGVDRDGARIVPNSRELGDRIDQARMSSRVHRDFEKYEAVLEECWILATSVESFPGQPTVLIQVALARSALFEQQGRRDEARAALQRIGLPGREFGARLGIVLEPAPEASRELFAFVRAHAAIQNALRALDSGSEEQTATTAEGAARAYVIRHFGLPGEKLSERIRGELRVRGDRDFILQLGRVAVPSVAMELLEDLDLEHGVPKLDPLDLLVQLDSVSAGRLVVDHLETAGQTFRLRVLRQLDEARAGRIFGDSTWKGSSGVSVCVNAVWLEVLAAFLLDSETRSAVLPAFWEVAENRGISRRLAEVCVEVLQQAEVGFAFDLVSILRVPSGNAAPILLAALEHDDARVRAKAAETLALLSNRVLLRWAEDPDEGVRLAVAQSLLAGTRTIHMGGRLGAFKFERTPEFDDEALRVLERLQSDASAEVRRTAATAAISAEETLPIEVYERIVSDPDPKIRVVVAERATKLPPAFVGDLLLALAVDPDERVAKNLDAVLWDCGWGEPKEWALELLEQRIAHPQFPFSTTIGRSLQEFVSVLTTPRVIARLVHTGLQLEDERVLVWTFDRVKQFGREGRGAVCELLSTADLVDVWTRVERLDSGRFQSMLEDGIRAADRRDVVGPVLSDQTLPWTVRIGAAGLFEIAETRSEMLFSLLRWPELHGRAPSKVEGVLLARISFESDCVEQCLLSIVEDERIADRVAALIVLWKDQIVGSSLPLARAILTRFVDSSCRSAPSALKVVAASTEARDVALVLSWVRRPEFVGSVVEALQYGSSPEYVEVLARALRGQLSSVRAAEVEEVRFAASASIFAYVGGHRDEVVSALLDGARTAAWRGTSQNIQESLDLLLQAEEKRLAFARIGRAIHGRGEAIEELFELIEDADPQLRAEAARAFGTLGVLDAMPRLIRALGDPEAVVREAVRGALDELHRRGREAEEDASTGLPPSPSIVCGDALLERPYELGSTVRE